MLRVIAPLAAPSNLGLRPPIHGTEPGTAKAPEAIRAAGLHRRIGSVDAGAVLPGRYVDDDTTRAAGTVRNQAALVEHAGRLADRLVKVRSRRLAPLVLGGDCSLLVGIGLANARSWRAGLVHIDGHTDFRHPGNSDAVGSVAGEDLAAAIGLHLPVIADIDGLAPYIDPRRTVHVGCREDDEERAEAEAVIADVIGAAEVDGDTADRVSSGTGGAPYWIQLDVDVLDPRWMPAVDSPDPGGLDPDRLIDLLRSLAPAAIGASVTVFDPDLDPTGEYAALLVEVLVDGLGGLGSALT